MEMTDGETAASLARQQEELEEQMERDGQAAIANMSGLEIVFDEDEFYDPRVLPV